MSTILEFAFLGLGIGAVYALLGSGLSLSTGIRPAEFPSKACSRWSGAYMFYEPHTHHGLPFTPSFLISILAVSLLGIARQSGVMRRLRHASGLARLIATLGILALLQGLATIRYGGTLDYRSFFFAGERRPLGDPCFSGRSTHLLAIAIALTVGLWALSNFTTIGLATSAVAENQRGAAALGWSPDASPVPHGGWARSWQR